MHLDNELRRLWQRFFVPIEQRIRIDGEALINTKTGLVVDGQPLTTERPLEGLGGTQDFTGPSGA